MRTQMNVSDETDSAFFTIEDRTPIGERHQHLDGTRCDTLDDTIFTDGPSEIAKTTT